jgi:membrane fusion protein (multidrug efflux system)
MSAVIDASGEIATSQAVIIRPSYFNRKRLLLIGIVTLITVSALYLGNQWLTLGRYIQSTDDAYVGGDLTILSAKVAGFVAQVSVADNQRVKAGDVLIKLDDRDFRAALAKAEALVAAQQAALANLDATRRLQESIIAEAKAGINATDAETLRAHDDQQRYQSLVLKALVSTQASQRADADFKQALANGEKAHASHAAALQQLNVISSQKQQVQAALAQALADLQVARLNLSYTELRAPIDGMVGNRRARVGMYAPTGSQLISIVPAQGLWVDANFKESQVAGIKAGQAVTVEADVLPDQVFHGRVVSLSPATGSQFSVLPTENATGNFTKIVQRVPVRIALDGDAATLGRLRPGLSVKARVDERPLALDATLSQVIPSHH